MPEVDEDLIYLRHGVPFIIDPDSATVGTNAQKLIREASRGLDANDISEFVPSIPPDD